MVNNGEETPPLTILLISVKSYKLNINMATLTKKDLLEAIEDMPMDAEIWVDIKNDFGIMLSSIEKVEYFDNDNFIYLC